MRFLILFIIFLFAQCFAGMGETDPRDRLDSTRLYGSWYKISSIKEDACAQCFRWDTTVYKIRQITQHELSELMPLRNYERTKHPLIFDETHYDAMRREYTIKGYIYNPVDSIMDTKYDSYWISYLRYDLMQEEGRDYSYGVIRFSMPVDDSLSVQLGTSIFGLKKVR